MGPEILPRSAWAGPDRPPGPLLDEAPGDVRFLLVHHSVNDNAYGEEAVAGLLRSIYDTHTRDKGWPDVAYNFFVDRFGRIWEGRAGSAERPVRGDATGGSQGFALLCCSLGDHRTEPPSPPARDAFVALLAHLAEREGVDVTPGATATFTSRGSNLHPAGTVVTTPTIAGHRDMSATECPGDAAYGWVTGELRTAVAERRAPVAPTTTTTTTSTTSTTVPVAPSSTTGPAPTTVAGSAGEEARAPGRPARPPAEAGTPTWWAPLGIGTVTAAGLGGLIALRRRTDRSPHPPRRRP